MKALILAVLSLFSVWEQPEPIKFEVAGKFPAGQERIDSCNKAIEAFADTYTDLWYGEMESCVYLDGDYLTPVSYELDEGVTQ